MAAGPKKKYKVLIVKGGIGDPLITLAFQFQDDPDFDNPVDYPVEDLKVTIKFTYNTLSGTTSPLKTAGVSTLLKLGTLDNYYLTFPFDQPEDIDMENANIGMTVFMAKADQSNPEENYTVWFENGNEGDMATALDDNANPVAFANLDTNYAYCPGGECITLGNG